MTSIASPMEDITGLVLSGGPSSRMGGVDKGLQNVNGMPLALLTLLRLQLQSGRAMISANRNLSAYEAMGVPVWPDSIEGYVGPAAGLLAGLEHAETEWLITAPCDAPGFPLNLVERMAAAVKQAGAHIAMATTSEDGQQRLRPEFCLVRMDTVESLVAFLHEGQRDLEQWATKHGAIRVSFDDSDAFFDANTAEELRALQRRMSA